MPPSFGTESIDDVDAPRRTMTEDMDASPVKKAEEIPC
jgi:hypothetical protein